MDAAEIADQIPLPDGLELDDLVLLSRKDIYNIMRKVAINSWRFYHAGEFGKNRPAIIRQQNEMDFVRGSHVQNEEISALFMDDFTRCMKASSKPQYVTNV